MNLNCLTGNDNPDHKEESIFGTANIDDSEEKTCRNIPIFPVVGGRAKTYSCSRCTGTFQIKKDYLNHYFKVHNFKSVTFNCEECSKAFSKIAHLKTHITRAHPKPGANFFFKCNKCPMAFNKVKDLDRHYINVHRVDKKRNYRCPNCPKVFDKKSHFQMHLSSHSTDRPYTCHICPDACFKFKSSLFRHFKITHKMEPPVASLSFVASKNTTLANPTFYDDDIHCEDVLDKNEYVPVHIHQCDKCPKTYRHEGNLARHFISEHKPFEHTEDKTGFNCDKCHTFFAKENSYKHHLTYYHNEYDGLIYRLFRCSICDLKFCTKRSFQMHMSDLHQVKKYMMQCEVCAKTFVSKHGWRLHITKVHEIANS